MYSVYMHNPFEIATAQLRPLQTMLSRWITAKFWKVGVL